MPAESDAVAAIQPFVDLLVEATLAEIQHDLPGR
jgi:hypothetical protein